MWYYTTHGGRVHGSDRGWRTKRSTKCVNVWEIESLRATKEAVVGGQGGDQGTEREVHEFRRGRCAWKECGGIP